jgi:hypothetical protein
MMGDNDVAEKRLFPGLGRSVSGFIRSCNESNCLEEFSDGAVYFVSTEEDSEGGPVVVSYISNDDHSRSVPGILVKSTKLSPYGEFGR